MTENTECSGTSAVSLLYAFFQNAIDKIVVLLHVTKMALPDRITTQGTNGLFTEKSTKKPIRERMGFRVPRAGVEPARTLLSTGF